MYIQAKKIRDYGPNFALFKINTLEASEVNTLEEGSSRRVSLPSNFNGVIAVREINFTGWAKGSTGKHRLNADNTNTIILDLLRVDQNNKVSAGRWYLLNQEEINETYRKERCWNI